MLAQVEGPQTQLRGKAELQYEPELNARKTQCGISQGLVMENGDGAGDEARVRKMASA